MSTVTLSPTSLIFPIRMPGQPSDGPLTVGITVTDPVRMTVHIEGPDAGAFTAGIVQEELQILKGAIVPTINPTKSTVVTPSTSNTVFWIIQVGFIAPLQLVPGAFSATLIVRWSSSISDSRTESGEQQIPLTGTSAQFTADVITAQPVTFPAGADPIVSLRLTYLSNDPTPLQALLTPEQFPTGLSFTPFNVTMTPRYVVVGENPKGSGNKPPSPPTQQLVTKTVATVPVHLKSQRLTAQLGKSSGGVQLQLPYLPGFAPEPPPTIAFNVQPLPIDVKVLSDQAAVIVPGVPASVGVSITTRGGDTIFNIEKPTGVPSGVKVGLASGGEIEIGDGTTSTHITIDAAFDPTSSMARAATLTFNWTANDGLSKDAFTIDIVIQPCVLVASSGSITAAQSVGIGVTGSGVWTLYCNGQWDFHGSVSSDDIANDDYSFGIVSDYFDAQQTAIGVSTTGTTVSNPGWHFGGYASSITSRWSELLSHGFRCKLSAKNQLGSVFGIAGKIILFLVGGTGGAAELQQEGEQGDGTPYGIGGDGS